MRQFVSSPAHMFTYSRHTSLNFKPRNSILVRYGYKMKDSSVIIF